ncbi:hypothetical protein [Asticcacaulis endophyticus]|jgi:2-polyprenyl-6-methoxyphenol hydroxylase-like FAD-dependent oxidoreductase|uniref:Uncharacterized protein n=1 Tax=Asticcacaulis endophyticus TaxID=1395890 RepID=A0A918Q1I0_9CAUL|nr:hypothetical protein [Asticcacaulis endophyticus]GGZ30358.1 hypothetical protein GCM10011273_15760 [Asticcacaulis endophyticus]
MPIRFELDRRKFGVLHFALSGERAAEGYKAVKRDEFDAALQSALKVNLETRRERLFGPKVTRFTFQGEPVTVRVAANGDVQLELGDLDDDVRETIIEKLRHSLEFMNI